MWPVVQAAIEFALGLQTPRGEIIWRRHEDGTPDTYALLTGSASMYQSLRCAIALADHLGDPQPDWELAAAQLGHAVACHREAFADKSRFSMDWYYPVLGGAVRGAAAERMLKSGWDTFVVPGLGVRCVSDEPWVTGAETCELAMALDAIGRPDQALELFEQIQFLRADGRQLLDRLAVREQQALPARAEQLDRGRGRAGRRRAGRARPVRGRAAPPHPPPERLAGRGCRSRDLARPPMPAACGCTARPAAAQPIPSPVRSSTRSDPVTLTSLNAPDASARR